MANHPTIKIGSKGAAVKLAQKRLVARGYGPLDQDGLFGPQTRNKVRTYQADREQDPFLELTVDGIIGPKTWARLDPATIKQGASGEAVKMMQDRLNRFSPPITAVAVDGEFGPATKASVIELQQFFGTLDDDGIVGPLTWTALWS